MFVLETIARWRAARRNAQTTSQALWEMNALPPQMQKDIGWPASSASRASGNVRSSHWLALG